MRRPTVSRPAPIAGINKERDPPRYVEPIPMLTDPRFERTVFVSEITMDQA